MQCLDSLSPQSGSGQDIGLVHQCHTSPASGSIGESDLCHPLYLRLGIHTCIESLVSGFITASRLTEIHTACKFPHHYEIRTVDDTVFQRRGGKQ